MRPGYLAPDYMHREVNRVQLAPLAASLLPSSTGKAKGSEASEKNPRASDPFSVRAIQDSNLWPLAPEGAPSSSTASAYVQALDETGLASPSPRPAGRSERPRTLRRGTLMAPALVAVVDGQRQFLSVREVAGCLGVSTALVYRLCDLGELTHVRISNAIRVQVEDLVAYLRSNRS